MGLLLDRKTQSRVRDTEVHQAPLSTGFSRQGYWRGLPCPPPGDLPDPGIESMSPALAGGFFTIEPPGKPMSPLRTGFFKLSIMFLRFIHFVCVSFLLQPNNIPYYGYTTFYIFVDNFLRYLWAFLPVFSLLSHFHSNRSQDFLFVSSEESLAAQKIDIVYKNSWSSLLKSQEAEQGLRKGPFCLGLLQRSGDISLCPQSVLGRQCALRQKC